ncbi:MAG: DegT/DnrJ/EryC1/StrS family aminotransferase [Desulfuromonadales bacterium]
MNIPMVDLKGQYRALKEEIDRTLVEVLESSQFILGHNVRALEEEIAAYCGVRHAVGVASGTDALHLALRAAGIGEGDEVITSPFTFIATAEAISYVGAVPVFVDIDPRTFNIDPALIEAAVTERTKAILPVHLFGQPADLDLIMATCQKYGLKLIEDCAQSFGADYKDRKSGSVGDLGCFSFFPSKNLGCFGDGGMVITDDDDLARELCVLRNHGSRERYHHSIIGYNSRLDEMQAAILRIKFGHIDTYNRRRLENARRYSDKLQGSKVDPPHEDGKGTHVYHQYTILTEQRDRIHKALGEAGIASAVYYPICLHRQEVYAERFAGVSLPVAERTAERVLSLPMYPELSEEQIDRVCTEVLGAVA